MITKTSKLSEQELKHATEIILQYPTFAKNIRPSTNEEIARLFKDPKNSWYTLTADDAIAVFKLTLRQKLASVDHFCVPSDQAEPYTKLISTLHKDLQRIGAARIKINVPKNMAEAFVIDGFKQTNEFLEFSGQPIETRMMPILRLTNPTQREAHEISKLLFEAYSAKPVNRFPTPESAELALQEIMEGKQGRYLTDASFVSGATPNIVSACLITLGEGNVAKVTELFTHPLYRARGLATTELAAAMNWLIKNKVEALEAVVENSNVVVRRLFTKVGLKEVNQLVELVSAF
ncbi:MAG TPA: GNAT family N-acetyltransferase [Candidatus Acidoferrales bacterium]|nr:GNAT family N-acetyltransferase [Candidatus Acidoferrales bacterium]